MATFDVMLTFFSVNSSGWLGNKSFFTLVKLEEQVEKTLISTGICFLSCIPKPISDTNTSPQKHTTSKVQTTEKD